MVDHKLEIKAEFNAKDAVRKLDRLEDEVQDLGKTTKRTGRDADKAGRAIRGMASGKAIANINKLKGALIGAAAAVGGLLVLRQATRAMTGLITETAALGDTLQKTSIRTGASVEFLSEMTFAAEQSGASFQSLNAGIRRFSRVTSDAQNGLAEAVRGFEGVGLSIANLTKGDGSLRTIEELLPLVADGFAKMTDDTKAAAVAQELFGRGGTDLLVFLKEGSAGLNKFALEARALGVSFGDDFAQNSADATDAVNRLEKAWLGLKVQLAGPVLEAVTKVANALTEKLVTPEVREAISDIGEKLAANLEKLPGIIDQIPGKVKNIADELKPLADAVLAMADSLGELQGVGGNIRAGINRGNQFANRADEFAANVRNPFRRNAAGNVTFFGLAAPDSDRQRLLRERFRANTPGLQRTPGTIESMFAVMSRNNGALPVREVDPPGGDAVLTPVELAGPVVGPPEQPGNRLGGTGRTIRFAGEQATALGGIPPAAKKVVEEFTNMEEALKGSLVPGIDAAFSAMLSGAQDFSDSMGDIIKQMAAMAAAAAARSLLSKIPVIGFLFAASGGLVKGGTPGVDSVPILAQQGERILSVSENRNLAGFFSSLSSPVDNRSAGIAPTASSLPIQAEVNINMEGQLDRQSMLSLVQSPEFADALNTAIRGGLIQVI